jgi:hypothetical protein
MAPESRILAPYTGFDLKIGMRLELSLGVG